MPGVHEIVIEAADEPFILIGFQLEHIIQQMTKQEGVTEELKAADQMEWIRRMKSIRSRTEAFVRHELVYYYKLCLKNARISS